MYQYLSTFKILIHFSRIVQFEYIHIRRISPLSEVITDYQIVSEINGFGTFVDIFLTTLKSICQNFVILKIEGFPYRYSNCSSDL